MDVAVKGLFWLLEAFRESPSRQRFVLIGGDAAVGHFFYRHPGPITEDTPHRAYPGCYALSKVLEEVMLTQYGVQYGLDWCCVRGTLDHGEGRFSASACPSATTFSAGPTGRRWYRPRCWNGAGGPAPCRCWSRPNGTPVKRNFVHVDDLVDAILRALTAEAARQRLYNIAMGRARRLRRRRAPPGEDARDSGHRRPGPLCRHLVGQHPRQGRTRWRPLRRLQADRFRLGLRPIAR